jgi:hypothetical protein
MIHDPHERLLFLLKGHLCQISALPENGESRLRRLRDGASDFGLGGPVAIERFGGTLVLQGANICRDSSGDFVIGAGIAMNE